MTGRDTLPPMGGPTPPAPPLPPAPRSTMHVWSLGKGVQVELRASAPLSAAQFEMLKQYVELAAKAERIAEGEAKSTSST